MWHTKSASSGIHLISTQSGNAQNRIVAILRLALCLLCAGAVYGQYNRGHRFSWQEYCFTNPSAIVCPGHEYFKKGPKDKDGGTPGAFGAAGIDWRFADPASEILAGFHPGDLASSPRARKLLVQLGSQRGVAEAGVNKIFDGLAGVDEVGLSIRDHRAVMMVISRAGDFHLPAPGEGMKAVTVAPKVILIGQTEAVDQAMDRMGKQMPLGENMRAADERRGRSDFWVIAPGEMAGPDAVTAGVKRLTLAVSFRSRVTTELSADFEVVPSADTLRKFLPGLGAVMIDSNSVRLPLSMDQICASPIGQHLPDLIAAASSLPAPDAAPSQPASTK